MAGKLYFTIETKQDPINAVWEIGILPLFQNSLPGFSVEEHTAPSAWFSDEPGVWEWKEPVIQEAGCAYGKFFEKKAAFISAEWFLDSANYRRDGYDFDARYDDGLASYKDKQLFDLVDAHAPVLSKTLKREGNYGKGGTTGFDTSMNRLQAKIYVVISNFVYTKDRYGREYGWGVAEYSTPEKFFRDALFIEAVRRNRFIGFWNIYMRFCRRLQTSPYAVFSSDASDITSFFWNLRMFLLHFTKWRAMSLCDK